MCPMGPSVLHGEDIMTAVCTTCNETKSKSDFKKRKDRPKGHSSSCTSCRQSKQRADWTPGQQSEYKLKAMYGITLADYEVLYNDQEGRCAICNKVETALSNTGYVKNLAVDHCHETGKVRGLLCNRCNVGLGMFEDNVNNLKIAIHYLNKEKI